jgi:hypothetical protein
MYSYFCCCFVSVILLAFLKKQMTVDFLKNVRRILLTM